MRNQFYDIVSDMHIAKRWFLDEPRTEAGEEVDGRDFTQGRAVKVSGPLFITSYEKGKRLDFTFAAFEYPVVTRRIGNILQGIAGEDIQLIPAHVTGSDEYYDILNVVSVVDALDESRSHVERWTSEMGRPDKIGKYSLVAEIKIDPARTHGHRLFRLKGWEIALIASEEVKKALEAEGVTGIRFWEA
jgi:hypothetical protein